MRKPLKRHEALKPLSREHHHGLLLCWKIREGIKRKVEARRIKDYADWFRINYLEPHFEAEETYVFPILGSENELVQRALSEHQSLKRLFDRENGIDEALELITEELNSHIRFEERVLFNEIQQIATPEQFAEVEKHHDGVGFSEDDWKDHFWKS